MAEEEPIARGPGLGTRTILVIVVIGVVIFSAILLTVRSCGVRPAGPSYTVIYSNLELKDAANVIARLKELKIPYEIREEGRAIAVPKERADEARLGLAEKGLPLGGAVGWEIFDQARLGATDFDRRIQFIRAISGELGRTIMRITAVDDARVQIVIPETRLFEVTKAPVTASVLLKLKPGYQLTREQVSGIIHLVASSVENLKPENVTIVDIYGNILSGIELPPQKIAAPPPEILEEIKRKEAELKKKEEELRKKEEAIKKVPEVVIKEAPKGVTPEEKALLKLKMKEELENTLTSRVQTLLNKFYPPNTAIVRVNVELGNKGLRPEGTQPEGNPETTKPGPTIKKITVIVLIDNKYELTKSLKRSTYDTIAAAVGYNRDRGDRIILRRVPFRYAVPLQPPTVKKVPEVSRVAALQRLLTREGLEQALAKVGPRNLIYGATGAFAAIIILLFLRKVLGGKPPQIEVPEEEIKERREGPALAIEEVRKIVDTDPERLAGIIERWLSEES